jgi:transglutaminase-like putative cysteine protease
MPGTAPVEAQHFEGGTMEAIDRAPCAPWRARALRAIALLALLPLAGHAADYRIGPAPGWVEAVQPEPRAAAKAGDPDVAYGVRYELVDDQHRLTAQDSSAWHHTVKQAVTAKGVDELAHYEVDFDPLYETLVLNQLDLVRDGRRVSRLHDARVKVLQRERDADSRIYDGRKSVELDLPDVRAGDTIEFAYTLSGANPVFARHHFGALPMQWAVAVGRVHRRLSVAAGVALRVATRNGAPAPTQAGRDGFQEWAWDAHDVAPLVLEADTPRSYDPYAEIQWTDFADWNDVARWARPLFRVPGAPGAALQADIDRLRAAAATPEERAVVALQWVQKQVRYLGIEMGTGSHAPSAPDVVHGRRFGDCKDKALLTVAIWRALGLEAAPVLVNTRRQSTGDTDLPMPIAFNHAITVLRVAGVEYWLDPTRPPQEGTLGHLAQAHYGRGLRLDDAPAAMAVMPPPNGAVGARDIDIEIDARGGPDKPAAYVVRTTWHGVAADRMRDELADGDLQQVQHRYLNFYADTWPGIRTAGPLRVQDDAQANTLTLTERYAIDDFWYSDKKHREPGIWLGVPDLRAELRAPSETLRKMPLGIDGPLNLGVHVDARLPEGWPAAHTRADVRNPAFVLMKETTLSGDHFRADYQLEVGAEEIAAAAVPGYARDLGSARRLLGDSVWLDERHSTAVRWLKTAAPGAGGALLVVLAAVFMFTLRRSGNAAAPASAAAVDVPPATPPALPPASADASARPASASDAAAGGVPVDSVLTSRKVAEWGGVMVAGLLILLVGDQARRAMDPSTLAGVRLALVLPLAVSFAANLLLALRVRRQGGVLPPPSPLRRRMRAAAWLAVAGMFSMRGQPDLVNWLIVTAGVGCALGATRPDVPGGASQGARDSARYS